MCTAVKLLRSLLKVLVNAISVWGEPGLKYADIILR